MFSLISLSEDLTKLADPLTAPLVVNNVPADFDVFNYLREIAYRVSSLIPVALVAHLFVRAGESMRRIGFDLSRPRFDLSLGLALAIAAHLAIIASWFAARQLGIPYRPIFGINADAPWQATVLLFVTAVTAAVSEEVIVNGYLITRLRDLEWSVPRAIAVSAFLRASYHTYQGIGGFVGNLVSGAVAGYVFARTKRIMPLVVAHFLIDAIAFFGDFFFADSLGWLR